MQLAYLENDIYLDLNSFGDVLVKADGKPKANGNQTIYVEASNENVDRQGEIVIQKSLISQKDFFLRNGILTYDHQYKGADGLKNIVGEPKDVIFTDDKRTLCKAELYALKDQAQELVSMIKSGSTRIRASIGGRVLEKVMDFKNGERVMKITKVLWTELALTYKPANDTLDHVSLTPMNEFKKNFICIGPENGTILRKFDYIRGMKKEDEIEKATPSVADIKKTPVLLDRGGPIYIEPKNDKNANEFAQCKTCSMFTGKRCTIHGTETPIKPTMSCRFYVEGDPMLKMAGKEHAHVTPTESGLVDHPVRCENCVAFNTDDSMCKLFELMNKMAPRVFNHNPNVTPKACCNYQTVESEVRAEIMKSLMEKKGTSFITYHHVKFKEGLKPKNFIHHIKNAGFDVKLHEGGEHVTVKSKGWAEDFHDWHYNKAPKVYRDNVKRVIVQGALSTDKKEPEAMWKSIKKALSAGQGTDSSGYTGGRALAIQSLSRKLAEVLPRYRFRDKKIQNPLGYGQAIVYALVKSIDGGMVNSFQKAIDFFLSHGIRVDNESSEIKYLLDELITCGGKHGIPGISQKIRGGAF